MEATSYDPEYIVLHYGGKAHLWGNHGLTLCGKPVTGTWSRKGADICIKCSRKADAIDARSK